MESFQILFCAALAAVAIIITSLLSHGSTGVTSRPLLQKHHCHDAKPEDTYLPCRLLPCWRLISSYFINRDADSELCR
jgi:hypothetical protein